MSNYTKTTDFEAKDSLPSGDSGKIIRGSEFETEFDNIATAIASKSDANNPTFTGTVTIDGLTVNGNTVLGNAATDTVTVTADIASNLLPSADDTYNLGAVGAEWNDLYVDGTAHIDAINFNGTAITATAAELNIMDGVTATTAELNIMDGVTATTTELNYVDGVTSAIQTQLNSKANLSGANFTGSIDVSGTVTADGLTVDGDPTVVGTVGVSADGGTLTTGKDSTGTRTHLAFNNPNGTIGKIDTVSDDLLINSEGDLRLRTDSKNRLAVSNLGDISFYEDTGTTAKFFWDASDESLRVPLGLYDNSINSFPSTGYAAIYSTGAGGSAPFNEAGHLVLQARSSGALRDIIFATGNGATERMRIDSSGNVGIGTDSPQYPLHTYGAVGISDDNDSARYRFIVDDDGTDARFRIRREKANGTASSSNDLTIVGGNVGIGTDSPTTNLDIAAASSTTLTVRNTSTVSSILLANGSSANQIFSRGANSSTGRDLAFVQGTSEAMRIDSAGRVGIGTTSPDAALHVEGAASTYLQLERTVAGSEGKMLVGAATNFNQIISRDSGTGIKGIQVVLGTDEAMRLDSSGNLLVGTTSSTLYNGTSGTGFSYRAGNELTVARSGASVATLVRQSNDGDILSFKKDGSSVGSIGVAFNDNLFISGDSSHAGIAFGTNEIYPSTTTGAGLDNDLNIGSSTARFKDLYLSNHSYVGANGTSPTAGGVFVGGDAVGRLVTSHATGTVSGNWYHAFKYDTNVIGSISQSGTTGVAYNTSSDQRLKENIVDAPSASDDIDAIQVRSFDWKADGSHQKYGMVAQELLTVAPDAVSQGLTEEDMMGVDYSKLVPMLVKEIQSLRARVAQLETN